MKNFALLPALALLLFTACTMSLNMQVMQRGTGKMYSGNIKANGTGSGQISINLKNKTCNGTIVRSSSNENFGLIQTYGTNGVQTGIVQNFGGAGTAKALLTCSDGTGLRCEFTGGGTKGTGVCVDSYKRVFDILVDA